MKSEKRKLYCPFEEIGDSAADKVINKFAIHIQLHYLRTSMHLTQEEASALSGISVSTISRLETSGSDVRLDSIINYAHALGYEVRLEKKGSQYGYTDDPE